MSFDWNSPPTAGTAPAQPTAAPPPFSGPPAGGAFAPRPLRIDEAMAGFGDAPIDVRDPFVPPNFAGRMRVVNTYGKQEDKGGFALYFIMQVLEVFVAGGGNIAIGNLKNPNMMPAAVGQRLAGRINGFASTTSLKFAQSDTKLFLLAALESDGFTVAKANACPPDVWNKMFKAISDSDPRFVGKEVLLQTSIVNLDKQYSKLKLAFAPLSAMQQKA